MRFATGLQVRSPYHRSVGSDRSVKGRMSRPLTWRIRLSRQFALLGVTGAVRMALRCWTWRCGTRWRRCKAFRFARYSDPARSRFCYDSRGLGRWTRMPREETKTLWRVVFGRKLPVGIPSLSEDLAAFERVRSNISVTMLRSWWITIRH